MLNYISFLSCHPKYVQNFINQTWMQRYQTNISQGGLTLLWSTIVSMFTLGGLIGTSVGGTLSVKLGRYGDIIIFGKTNSSFVTSKSYCVVSFRRGTLLANNAFSLTAALLMGLSSTAGSFELLIIGRLLSGMNAGKNSQTFLPLLSFPTFCIVQPPPEIQSVGI